MNFYPDSNFYHRITKGGNEAHWNEFIDECEINKIELPNGYTPLFTYFLLLERIGLGTILEPLQKDSGYKSMIKLIQNYIKNMPDLHGLSPASLENLKQEIADLIDGMSKIFSSLLYRLPQLEIVSFLERFDREINIYATSKAAGELIQETLKRHRQFYNTEPDCLAPLIGHLTWNLIATFPFIEPEHVPTEKAFATFKKAEMWFNCLFASFHKTFISGYTIGFFRLAENRLCTYLKIIKRNPNNPEFDLAKDRLAEYKPLRRKDDLCDGELIDFAVLGCEGKKTFCFTSDKYEDIKNRLRLLKSTLEDLARDVTGWSINPCWGRVYCISESGQPLKITHSFVLDQPIHEDRN